ncbi:DUF5708 family protein [Paenarthrobacter nitroguajacolicus]|uniref:DUF5708 family protein n=1 Tax=Paenarthrobacter nitroguajacolicus TaxID=211146 RepID=UPI003AEA4E7F
MRGSSGRTEILWGAISAVVGLLLWLFAGDIETPIITLSKVGVVLMAVGGGGILYGIYMLAKSGARKEQQ